MNLKDRWEYWSNMFPQSPVCQIRGDPWEDRQWPGWLSWRQQGQTELPMGGFQLQRFERCRPDNCWNWHLWNIDIVLFSTYRYIKFSTIHKIFKLGITYFLCGKRLFISSQFGCWKGQFFGHASQLWQIFILFLPLCETGHHCKHVKIATKKNPLLLFGNQVGW